MEVIDQPHTDSINSDTVNTQTEIKEAECSLEEESEMLVDEDSSKEKKKRKVTSDECQSSGKVKKISPQTESLQSGESEGDEESDVESLASSQEEWLLFNQY